MLYAVAQNYLLSGDRDRSTRYSRQPEGARLVPGEMRAADVPRADDGLDPGPLNDLTRARVSGRSTRHICTPGWTIRPRAGQSATLGPPNAKRRRATIHDAVQRGFGAAAMRSPVVELRDRTWEPYVPV